MASRKDILKLSIQSGKIKLQAEVCRLPKANFFQAFFLSVIVIASRARTKKRNVRLNARTFHDFMIKAILSRRLLLVTNAKPHLCNHSMIASVSPSLSVNGFKEVTVVSVLGNQF